MLHVIEFSHDLELQRIIMEGDAAQIVNVVKATKRNWSRYRQLGEDTKGVLKRLHNWQICHRRKEAF